MLNIVLIRFRYEDVGTRYCIEAPYANEDTPELWKAISNTVTNVFQFQISNDGEVVTAPEVWTVLPSHPISQEELRLVFDVDEADQLRRVYQENRAMNINGVN